MLLDDVVECHDLVLDDPLWSATPKRHEAETVENF
jgi:hypothetical protein